MCHQFLFYDPVILKKIVLEIFRKQNHIATVHKGWQLYAEIEGKIWLLPNFQIETLWQVWIISYNNDEIL